MVQKQPRAIGKYRILKRLGEGGMGVVYLAMRKGTARRVALKTVQLKDAAMLGSLRREIRALSRIEHPGIVRVVDQGLHAGVPWYAMEHLDGTTLRDYIAGLCIGEDLEEEGEIPATTALPAGGTDPELLETQATGAVVTSGIGQAPEEFGSPRKVEAAGGALPEVLTLVRRLCSPLAYLHGEGFVHRDLKPENILVRPDGTPILVDFGLLSAFAGAGSREEIQVGGGVSGTLAYMAPEQARGEFVDARADLYSIGCMLYELLTGRRPFRGKDPAGLIWQHQHAAVVPPSAWVTDLPEELDELTVRLLAKEPRKRIGYAEDVADVLSRLGAEEEPGDEPRPTPYLYRPALSGREEAMQTLTAALDRLRKGEGGLVLLAGESGVGKTRLATEAGSIAKRRKVEVLAGACEESRKMAIIHGLLGPLRAIGDRCRERGRDETDRLLGRRGKVLALYEPSLASLPGQDAYPEPVELPGNEGATRLMSYLAETLLEVASRTPLLLILDDIQWADHLTLGVIETLRLGGWMEKQLLVLATYRSEEETKEIRTLANREKTVLVEISRLSEESIGSMVSDMLALEAPPKAFVSYLSRASEGNPFYVSEYLLTAIAEGVIRRDEDRLWRIGEESMDAAADALDRLTMPRTVRELVARRLTGLSAGAQALAEAGAVLGREIPVAWLLKMSDLEVEEADIAMRDLVARQVMEERGPRLRFLHDKIREVILEELAAERKRKLHRRAAEMIEADPHREAFLPGLAHHWEEAGERVCARERYREAARLAAQRYAPEEAEKLYGDYFRLVDVPSEESIRARIALAGGVLSFTGRLGEAESVCRLAMEELRQAGLLELEGVVLRALGNTPAHLVYTPAAAGGSACARKHAA